MVEHMFAAGSRAGLGEARGALDAAARRLRSLDLAGLGVDQLTALSRDLESHRRVVAAASARTAAAIASHAAPASGGDDDGAGGAGGGEEGGGPVPPAGGAGEATGSDRDEANRQRRAARVAQVLPSAIAALDAGAVSTGHIAALWFACDTDPARARRDETHLVAWARRFPVSRLRQLVRNWCRLGENPEDRAAEQDTKRGVYFDTTHPDAMIRLNATMRTADGKQFQAALDAIADDLYRAEHPDRPRSSAEVTTTVAQRRHDALVEIAHRANGGTRTTAGTRRRRPTITIIATLEQLRDGLGHAETPDGDALSAADLRRLACDTDIVPAVFGADSQILDLGHRTRTPTPALWDALVARDRCCTHPHCTTPAQWCDAHHIVHWAHGGPTNPANLTLLCRRHHTALHNGNSTITGAAPNLQWHQPANAPPQPTGPPVPPA